MNNLLSTSPHERIVARALMYMMDRHSRKCLALGFKSVGPSEQQRRSSVVSSTPIVELNHPLFALDIHPRDTDEIISWVVRSGAELPFCSITEKAIVYLRVPVADGFASEITMADNIYWICGDIVVAAGEINKILHDDIIVHDDFLVVPVIAIPFRHRFQPFRLVEAAAYYMECFSELYKPMDPVSPALADDPFSCLAFDILESDGAAILEFIQEDFRTQ